MTKKSQDEEDKKKGVSAILLLIVPILIVIADIWVGGYFYFTYKDTWMQSPILITSGLVFVIACVLFLFFVASLDGD
jgi:hypothetical protein